MIYFLETQIQRVYKSLLSFHSFTFLTQTRKELLFYFFWKIAKRYYRTLTKEASRLWNKEVKKTVPPFADNFPYHVESSKLIRNVINWLVSIWWGHYSYMGGRNLNVLNISCASFKLQHCTFLFIYNQNSDKTRVFVHLERFHLGSTDTFCGTSHCRYNKHLNRTYNFLSCKLLHLLLLCCC